MTGAHLLIAAVIIALVIAFIVTMLVLNASAKKIISTNAKLVENQNTLLEQNKAKRTELEKRISELEERKREMEAQKRELEEQKELIDALQQRQDELSAQLQHGTTDEVTKMREQARRHREHIELTSEMTNEELLAWIDQRMDETRLYTDSNLTLRTTAKALGLTQKRLGGLFKDHPKYNSLGDYLNEKRFLYACRLLREEPHWTIEAVGAEAGFGGRRTFQIEVKRRLGITPFQYRQAQAQTANGEE